MSASLPGVSDPLRSYELCLMDAQKISRAERTNRPISRNPKGEHAEKEKTLLARRERKNASRTP
jgi:hypothetical protein